MANLWTRQHAGSRNDSVTDLPSYLSGYFDGEGCFTVSIAPRRTLRVRWEVRPSASVSQNADRSEVLDEIQQYFGCGTIRPDPGDKTVKWEVRSLRPLLERVVPHFRQYPLRSSKQQDFERFFEVCELMARGEHLVSAGLIRIATCAQAMNPSGRRRYHIEEILETLNVEMKA